MDEKIILHQCEGLKNPMCIYSLAFYQSKQAQSGNCMCFLDLGWTYIIPSGSPVITHPFQLGKQTSASGYNKKYISVFMQRDTVLFFLNFFLI